MLHFENKHNAESTKIGHNFTKWNRCLKISVNTKILLHKLVILNENQFRWPSYKIVFKSPILPHFENLAFCYSQNTIISLEYVQFCRITSCVPRWFRYIKYNDLSLQSHFFFKNTTSLNLFLFSIFSGDEFTWLWSWTFIAQRKYWTHFENFISSRTQE